MVRHWGGLSFLPVIEETRFNAQRVFYLLNLPGGGIVQIVELIEFASIANTKPAPAFPC
jgi:hypothetical protein